MQEEEDIFVPFEPISTRQMVAIDPAELARLRAESEFARKVRELEKTCKSAEQFGLWVSSLIVEHTTK